MVLTGKLGLELVRDRCSSYLHIFLLGLWPYSCFCVDFLASFCRPILDFFGAYLKAIWKVFLGCFWSFCTGLLLSLTALTLVEDLSTHFSAFYLDFCWTFLDCFGLDIFAGWLVVLCFVLQD